MVLTTTFWWKVNLAVKIAKNLLFLIKDVGGTRAFGGEVEILVERANINKKKCFRETAALYTSEIQ